MCDRKPIALVLIYAVGRLIFKTNKSSLLWQNALVRGGDWSERTGCQYKGGKREAQKERKYKPPLHLSLTLPFVTPAL